MYLLPHRLKTPGKKTQSFTGEKYCPKYKSVLKLQKEAHVFSVSEPELCRQGTGNSVLSSTGQGEEPGTRTWLSAL